MEVPHDGERIAAVRTSLGLSRADMAAMLDVAFETLKGWEVGRRSFREGVWDDVLALRDRHDAEVAARVAALSAREGSVLVIDEPGSRGLLGWDRSVAAGVLRELPDTRVVRASALY